MYATPVVAWQTSAQTIVPLPYGPTTDWCRNVLAYGGCHIQIRGHWYAAHAPQLLSREAAVSYLPPAARTAARVLPVQSYLRLQTTAAPAANTDG